jgi:ClpP class serine protease
VTSVGIALKKLHKARDSTKYEAIAISINSCTGDQYHIRKLVDAIDELSKKNLYV